MLSGERSSRDRTNDRGQVATVHPTTSSFVISKMSAADPIRMTTPRCLPTISTTPSLSLTNRHLCSISPASRWIQSIQDTVGIRQWHFWPSRSRRCIGNLCNDRQNHVPSAAMRSTFFGRQESVGCYVFVQPLHDRWKASDHIGHDFSWMQRVDADAVLHR